MASAWYSWFDRFRPKLYGRKQPLILVNGLAEQAETWWRNHRFWSRFFEIHMPNILAYEGEALHRRIDASEPITVDYLVEQYYAYLDQFVQRPPYQFVASSLGGKIVVEFAAKYPQLVDRIVLICPSGLGDEERLPFIEGVRRNDVKSVITSVFHKRRHLDRDMVRYYATRFPNRRWRVGFLRTVRGTMDHVVRSRLKDVPAQTLLITGLQDRIVDPKEATAAVLELPQGHHLRLKRCGHAPQIEKPWLINRLVAHFLTAPNPTSHPGFAKLLFSKPRQVTT